MPEDTEQLTETNRSLGEELMKAKFRIAQLEDAIRAALPLETFWLDYSLAGKVSTLKPLSSVLRGE